MFTLETVILTITLNEVIIPTANSLKYVGLHLNQKLI